MKKLFLFLFAALAACSNDADKSDAFGNFEAVEIIVSAEGNGKIVNFEVEEGQIIEEDAVVGQIDTAQLHFQKERVVAQRSAVSTKTANILAQIDVLKQQKEIALKDLKRVEKMYEDKAATEKQLDDVKGRIAVIDKQIQSIETQNSSVLSELRAMDAQIGQLRDAIEKCKIVNPIRGSVLNKFVEESEIAGAGKPLYKIANLDELILRFYVSGAQLSSIKIGDKIDVLFDKDKNSNFSTKGKIIWISSKAEFTPKIIQTKEERVNMVYAVKALVENDGSMKIGMPGEVKFH